MLSSHILCYFTALLHSFYRYKILQWRVSIWVTINQLSRELRLENHGKKRSYLRKFVFHIVLCFCHDFYTMSFSFQTKVASHGFHIHKNTALENANIGQEISVQLETNEDSKKINPHCCAIKTMVSGKLEIVRHIPREVSRYTYFCIKEEWGRMLCFFNTLSSLTHS